MTPPGGDEFLDRLAELDAALAAGAAGPSDPAAGDAWRESAAVLAFLHRENPRRRTPRPGRVGRFVIDGVLGRGASGVVYAATDPRSGRRVAVKVSHESDAAALARFRAEGAALAAVTHPHVVRVFETGEHEGRPFLVLEWVAGGALGAAAPGDESAERNAARLVSWVARGVGAAHAAGVVHGDLKPANILLTGAGVPKVADFGLALRGAGGTPQYVSPEQAAGRVFGAAADVYALGAILYELLTGRPPFLGVVGFDVLRRVVNEPPVGPAVRSPSVPRELDEICLRCLAKTPADRYPTAEALADALDSFLSWGRFPIGRSNG